MPNIKKFATAVALSTALAGGVVGLGSAATVTSAAASDSAVSGGRCHSAHFHGSHHRVTFIRIKLTPWRKKVRVWDRHGHCVSRHHRFGHWK